MVDNKHILYVEDDGMLRKSTTMLLGFDYEVTAVADGNAALKALQNGRFDLVLTDHELGAGPNGFDVARAARAADADVPIVMYSGFSMSRRPIMLAELTQAAGDNSQLFRKGGEGLHEVVEQALSGEQRGRL